MALNINGTTGISGVDGSASAPALTGTDSNTGINFASDTVNINTGGTTRATIDSSGKLNLTSNIKWSSANPFVYTFNGGSDGQVRSGIQFDGTNQQLAFYTGTNERMRIASDGKVNIGGSSGLGSKFVVRDTSFDLFGVFCNSESHGTIQTLKGGTSGSPAGTLTYISFQRNDGDTRGSITNSGNIQLSFNTSSDYRLKENVVSISDGITRLKTLKPSRFNFKEETDITVDGFLAHEVTAVPEAVTGTKDAVDENGKIIVQQLDQSKLVPLLTAALQEAVTKIEVLETRLNNAGIAT